MKVLNIEELKKTDGSSYWEVTIPKKDGTPSGSPLLEWEKPTYNIGEELPFDVVLVKPSNARWYYKRKDTPSQGDRPTEDKPKYTPRTYPKNDDDIMLQVAFKGAIELETHHNPPEGKINTARVIQATSELFASLILMRPKKV